MGNNRPSAKDCDEKKERGRNKGENGNISELAVLERPFKIIAFDWDGTAVANRKEDATSVRYRLERLLQLGVRIVVITGTNFGNVHRQLSAYIEGPEKQRLYICTNRGSEVYSFDAESKPILLWQREATPEEDGKLTKVAETVEQRIETQTGLEIVVIYDRLNRRKIDLIPVPEWADPPKSMIGHLLEATEKRLIDGGLKDGLKEAFSLTKRTAKEVGLRDPRITSDVKHIEVGLTDKSDSISWMMEELAAKKGIPPCEILIAGDEFGPIAGFEGSDYRMVTPAAKGAVYVSVGPEPNGTPPGVLHLGGGPKRFRELLDQQIALLERQIWGIDLPCCSDDPTWLLYESGFNPAREHEIESIFTVANGYIGTRGALSETNTASNPATFIAGVFDAALPEAPIPELVVAPNWIRLELSADSQAITLERGETLEHRRTLDMRRALLMREWRHRDNAGRITRVSTLRFVSLIDRHALSQIVAVTPENYSGRVRIESFVDGRVLNRGAIQHLLPVRTNVTVGGPLLVMRTKASDVVLAFDSGSRLCGVEDGGLDRREILEDSWFMERWDWEADLGRRYRLDQLAAVYTSRDTADPAAAASQTLDRLWQKGPERVLADHAAAWAERWREADVEIRGDQPAQRAIRFALYHLIGAAHHGDERVSIGARALTGQAYAGHVFWDTETFMLPFYIFTHPATARALLMYRYHTLHGARAKAKTMGYRGALYAWESAATGEETTPPMVITPDGRVIPVLCGTLEQHISADIAFAVWQYWQATGDETFLRDAGAEIILEVARFWASRLVLSEDDQYHIFNVIGPDEYHEEVNDNAFTNWLARWSLEKGREVADMVQRRWPDRWQNLVNQIDLKQAETTDWARIASKIALGYDASTGMIEQFAGYFGLEYIDVKDYEPRSAPMDVLLGRERTHQSQVIKQADVVLLLDLLWDRFTPKDRETNFRYYEPRTGHGSSLSPGIYALVAAKLGDPNAAMRYFRQAYEIDLADNMGNAAGGVHAAAQGSIWQAIVFGFAGLSLRQDGLQFEPHLPKQWTGLSFAVQWHGRTVRLTFRSEPRSAEVLVEGLEPMVVQLGQQPVQLIQPRRRYTTEGEAENWGPWKEVKG